MTQESGSAALVGTAVNHGSLYTAASDSGLTMKNFICGIANFGNDPTAGTGIRAMGIQGNNCSSWQTFSFDIDAGMTVSSSAVSLSLLGISNQHAANDMNYAFRNVRSSQNGTKVTVNGEVLVGDTDGWLFQLGYLCIVA